MDLFNAGVRFRKATKGVSLIIAVFTMMILAILGLTMAMMISGDFEMNTRNLESEQAFYLADSGIQDALMHLSLAASGDVAFDNDADYLKRRLGNGEYNVTRQTNGVEVNVTSRGFIPSENNYRALREVSVVVIPSGLLGVSAFTGGELFDWHYRWGFPITVNGVIGASNYEGDDLNRTMNQTAPLETDRSDFAVPPTSEERIWTPQIVLPELNMTELSLLNDKSIPGMKVEHWVGDKTFSGNYNNKGFIFVEGNVTIDTNIGKFGADFSHSNIIATGNINIIGSGPMTITAHVKPNGKSYPVLATKYGNIIASTAPSGNNIKDRHFEGLIFSQYGTVDINCIEGNSIMARIVRLRGNVYLDYDAKRIDMDNGFTDTGGTTIRSWQEQ